MYVDTCIPDCCVDGSVNEEGLIDYAALIAIKFQSVLDSCPIKKDHFWDDVIIVTGLPRESHEARPLRKFTSIWLLENISRPPFNINNDVAQKAKLGRPADRYRTWLVLML